MTTTVTLLVALGVLAALVVFFYNRLVALRQAMNRAFSNIDNRMKNRYDLIPNLMRTVKGYAQHEESIFTRVTEARAMAMKAGSPGSKCQAEAQLEGSLMKLMAVAENYPELKANANFQHLQSELADIENKIGAARDFYNYAVKEYNIKLEQFPDLLIARMFNFKAGEFFTLDNREEQSVPPKVEF